MPSRGPKKLTDVYRVATWVTGVRVGVGVFLGGADDDDPQPVKTVAKARTDSGRPMALGLNNLPDPVIASPQSATAWQPLLKPPYHQPRGRSQPPSRLCQRRRS